MILPWFQRWRVNAVPPIPLSTVPPPINPQTAKLEEVGETCIFALRSRLSGASSVTNSEEEKSTGDCCDVMIKPLESMTADDILPTEKASQVEKLIDFSKLGVYVPQQEQSWQPQEDNSDAESGDGDNNSGGDDKIYLKPILPTNSLMPPEYRLTMEALQARYGFVAPTPSQGMTNRPTAAAAPMIHYAIPQQPSQEQCSGPVATGPPLSSRMANLSVESVLASVDLNTSREISIAKETLASKSIQERVASLTEKKVKQEIKKSIKWLSTPPKKKKGGEDLDFEFDLNAKAQQSSPQKSLQNICRTTTTSSSPYSKSVEYRSKLRSPLRNISMNSTEKYVGCGDERGHDDGTPIHRLPIASLEHVEDGSSINILKDLKSKIDKVSEELGRREKERKWRRVRMGTGPDGKDLAKMKSLLRESR